jgi:hypothetical protein
LARILSGRSLWQTRRDRAIEGHVVFSNGSIVKL